MASSSPLLDFDVLTAISTSGGYSRNPRLSKMASVLCLSAIVAIRQKWMWQPSISPITESEWQQINETIDQVTYELMRNNIGEIFSSIGILTDDSVILMDGSNVLQVDYPELTAIVPVTWLVGADIVIPDMREVGVFGAINGTDIGSIVGANTHQLTTPEMPNHTHIQNSHAHIYNSPLVAIALGGEIPATASLVTTPPILTSSVVATNQNTGGDNPHNNIQESLKVYWYLIGK